MAIAAKVVVSIARTDLIKEHTELKENRTMTTFKEAIMQGIPAQLPPHREVPGDVNRAPKRKEILNAKEKRLAIENALRYFPKEWHEELAAEFAEELKEYGRIYMYRFKPNYEMKAHGIHEYPAQSRQAA